MAAHRLVAGRLAPERTAARLARPLRRFVETEVSSGVVLLAAVVAALAWANSPWKETYVALWSTEIHVAIGRFGHSATIEAAVNDGLMALFFFVVGLEVKSELIRGHLRKPRRAAMPAIAALFGMAVPVAIYLAINSGGPAARGWGVPIATDIALALGVLSLAGRVPEELRVLLLGIAISLPVYATIRVGVGPNAVAITPDGKSAYVANVGGTVSVIDTATSTVSATLAVDSPFGIAVTPDGNHVYVTSTGPSTVSVIDTETDAVVHVIALLPRTAGPLQIAFTPSGEFAYVTTPVFSEAQSVSVIDTKTNAVVTAIPVGNMPRGIAIVPGCAAAT
jgi:YVTN family beta-propeller protein